jgi:hypothetical protein
VRLKNSKGFLPRTDFRWPNCKVKCPRVQCVHVPHSVTYLTCFVSSFSFHVCSGHADDAYYLSDKVNQCVVCGHTGEYLRHSIVPHTYRCAYCLGIVGCCRVLLLCCRCNDVCSSVLLLSQSGKQSPGMTCRSPDPTWVLTQLKPAATFMILSCQVLTAKCQHSPKPPLVLRLVQVTLPSPHEEPFVT